MDPNQLDPFDHAAGVLPTDSYLVRMDKRAESGYPLFWQGSDAFNAFLARVVVAALLCGMFFFAVYKPWVDPIIPNAGIFILAAVCLFFVVLAFRSVGFATSVLVIGFLGAIAATFVKDYRTEAARREAALLQEHRAHAPLGACGIYFAALANHQKEGEQLKEQKCLAAMRAERSKTKTSPARPSVRKNADDANDPR